MKRLILVLFGVAVLAAIAAGQRARSIEFRSYPAAVEKATAKSIDFRRSPGASTFRTRLRAAIKEGDVNFAGRYILTGWGCGSGCSQMAIIDAKTGRVYMPDALAGVSAWYYDVDDDYEVYTYKKNSRLLIVRGIAGPMTDGDSEQKPGTYYYEWRANRLRLIKFIAKPKPKNA
jgi:hypothetical protein